MGLGDRKVVRDDQEANMGRDVLVGDGFGGKSPRTIRRKYPNALCCMKACINHKIHHVFNVEDFR